MNTKRIVAAVSCLVVAGVAFAAVVLAQEKPVAKPDWSRLQVVTYASGLTGFFDRDTGKIYVYDANMEKCFAVRQLVALGEPLVEVKR